MLGWFWVTTRVPCVASVFSPRRDHVVIKVSLSRLGRSRQEVEVATGLG